MIALNIASVQIRTAYPYPNPTRTLPFNLSQPLPPPTSQTTTFAAASPDAKEHSKNDILSSSEDEEKMGFNEPTGHPFVGLTFTSWKEVTNAVQCAALQENKLVLRHLAAGTRRFTNVCTGLGALSDTSSAS